MLRVKRKLHSPNNVWLISNMRTFITCRRQIWTLPIKSCPKSRSTHSRVHAALLSSCICSFQCIYVHIIMMPYDLDWLVPMFKTSWLFRTTTNHKTWNVLSVTAQISGIGAWHPRSVSAEYVDALAVGSILQRGSARCDQIFMQF